MNMIEGESRLCGLKYEVLMTVSTGKAKKHTGLYFLHSKILIHLKAKRISIF